MIRTQTAGPAIGSSEAGSREGARPRFEPAGPADDAALRRLLRDTPMGGAVQLALTREPDYFDAAAADGIRHDAVVLRGQAGEILALGARSVREVWWEGRPARLGYLEQLRFAPGRRLGRRGLAEGYARLLGRRREDELPFHLTSIVADNRPARRLLERTLPGLPEYARLAELVTLVIPTRRRPVPAGVRGAGAAELEEMETLLAESGRRRRLAPRWPRERLLRLAAGGHGAWRPLVARRSGRCAACGAVWDRRGERQCVVTGYAPLLAGLRPWLSPVLRLFGAPALPPPGTTLRLGYLSHLAAEEAAVARDLVTAARSAAAGLGLDLLALGLPAGSSLLPVLRRSFRGRAYRSVLYLVRGPGDPPLPSLVPDDVAVEVATL